MGTQGITGARRRRRHYSQDDKAIVWTLREQGLSLRTIEVQTGIPYATAWRILRADPVRNETIETRLRLQQTQEFEELAARSRRAALKWVRHAEEAADIPKDKRIPKHTAQRLRLIPPTLHALSGTATHSSRAGGLLAGRPTSRVERTPRLRWTCPGTRTP